MDANSIICLDTEFTHIGEPLELSIYNIDGNEIYHQLFKPSRSRTWPLIKHRITPESVVNMPRFFKCAEKIQSIIRKATHIIGYAVDGDIDILSKAGISEFEHLDVIEVREWYWLCKGKDEGVDLYSVPNLAACATMLGLEVSEDETHGASYDTWMTLSCFKLLAEIFRTKYLGGRADVGLQELTENFHREYEKEKDLYLERRAACFFQLIAGDKGYKIKRTSTDEPLAGSVAIIPVKDRYSAELFFLKKFSRRRNPAHPHLYLLKPSDINLFKEYEDTYSKEESALSRSLLNLNNKRTVQYN